MASQYSRVLCCASDRAAVGPTFTIFSYDASPPQNRTNVLHVSPKFYVASLTTFNVFSHYAVWTENHTNNLCLQCRADALRVT